MSWLMSPSLVKKPRAADLLNLPAGVRIEKVRQLLLLSVVSGGFLGACIGLIGRYFLSKYELLSITNQILFIGLSLVVGSIIGGSLMIKVLRAAITYGHSQTTSDPPYEAS